MRSSLATKYYHFFSLDSWSNVVTRPNCTCRLWEWVCSLTRDLLNLMTQQRVGENLTLARWRICESGDVGDYIGRCRAVPSCSNGRAEKFLFGSNVFGVFDTIISFVFSCENQFRFVVGGGAVASQLAELHKLLSCVFIHRASNVRFDLLLIFSSFRIGFLLHLRPLLVLIFGIH